MPRKDAAAVSLGRKGGKARTPAKAAAARENGKRGGRPKTKHIAIGHPSSALKA